MRQKYAVFIPTAISPETVIHTRFGRHFDTLQAARRVAKAVKGQIRPFGSGQVLEDHF